MSEYFFRHHLFTIVNVKFHLKKILYFKLAIYCKVLSVCLTNEIGSAFAEVLEHLKNMITPYLYIHQNILIYMGIIS